MTINLLGGIGVPGGYSNTIIGGSEVPSSADGTDGDFYIRTANWTIYGPKTAGAWGTAAMLVGPAGPAGPVTYATFAKWSVD